MSTGTAQALADLTGTEVQILDGCTRSTAQLNYVDATSCIQNHVYKTALQWESEDVLKSFCRCTNIYIYIYIYNI